MAKPRVAICGPSLTAVSGISTHLNQLLRSDLASDVQFIHFQVGSQGRHENALQRVARAFLSPLQLLIFMLRRQPGIIHINTTMTPRGFWRDAAYVYVARAAGRKVLYQVHGGVPPNQFFPPESWRGRFLRSVLRCADVIVVLSTADIAIYGELTDASKVRVIPNGVFLPESVAPVSPAAAPLQLVFLGRLVAAKGIDELISAMAILKQRGIPAKLTLAGAGPEETRLQSAVREAKLEDIIEFAGAVFGEEKRLLWARSAVFVFPSHDEKFPYSLLEAMAAGVVPVTCPVGAIPEMMEDRVHGLFVPLRDPRAIADAVERLYRNPDLRWRMRDACRERIETHFTMTKIAAQYRQVYMSLTAS